MKKEIVRMNNKINLENIRKTRFHLSPIFVIVLTLFIDATVSGPLIEGLLFEFAGLVTPFFTSASILIVAFGLGCRVLQVCVRTKETEFKNF